MTLTRAMRVLGASTLAGALLLTAAPGASADQVRDGQWANQYFKLDKVWSVSKGDNVIVAVIDSGVDATHPDLTGQVLPGYDESGQNLNTKPTESHGTGMASLIAGHGHGANAGVVGLAPGARILPVYKGDANALDVIPQGIRWAVDHGAKVINISQAASVANSEMQGAVAYAYQHDVLVVAGAGNTGGAVANPANLPGVLAVAAADKSSEVWSSSNSGPEVRLAAPGVDIVSAGKCGSSQYCLADGTSDATAYVSAAAALVRAKFPQLTAGQVANRLAKSAAVPPSAGGAKLPDPHFGYGVIRPYEALTMDIPAGSKEGPLTKPEGVAAPGTASNAPVSQPVTKSSVGGGITPLMVLGALAVMAVLLVVVIVAVTRSRRRPQAAPVPPQGQAPYGAAPYGAAPGWPPAQQPYGTQPPPPGYPQQQPYQNPYQGGNPPR